MKNFNEIDRAVLFVFFIAIVAGSSVVQVYDREYNRLQLDLNYAF